MYEPVHGSAPDIAGKGMANPIAMFGSFAMTLRYSFGMTDIADKLERAISDVLDQGLRTKDIASAGQNAVSTSEMGDAILKQLQKLAG
jgi:3-isopropylmalate dehydrogenase